MFRVRDSSQAISMPNNAFTPEPRSEVVRRRVFTIARDLGLLVLLTLLSPVVLAAALFIDVSRWLVTRNPFMGVRALVFLWVFLAAEMVGLLWLAAQWVGAGFGTSSRRMTAAAWRVQTWWAQTLFSTVEWLFALDVVVDDLEVVRPGPIVALFRHASIIDNLLPATLLSDRAGLRMRWILKRELLSIPALDVAGKRLPNYFVDRSSASPSVELKRIRALAVGLGEDEGVLIYPEGTRFTEAKRTRAIARLEKTEPELAARARAMRYVLPPRTGGALQLLDAGIDVVVCAHEGLGGFASVADIWSGALMGRVVRVRFWRTPADQIPPSREDRVDWLFSEWQRADEWIASHKT
jgi:1-acyl-sn-glycerol-3-phosphate acyltransferase